VEMMIGTDSHINAGGLGMLAIGVGTDAVDVMSWDGNCFPKLIGEINRCCLVGQLQRMLF
jgi:aconitase A